MTTLSNLVCNFGLRGVVMLLAELAKITNAEIGLKPRGYQREQLRILVPHNDGAISIMIAMVNSCSNGIAIMPTRSHFRRVVSSA